MNIRFFYEDTTLDAIYRLVGVIYPIVYLLLGTCI